MTSHKRYKKPELRQSYVMTRIQLSIIVKSDIQILYRFVLLGVQTEAFLTEVSYTKRLIRIRSKGYVPLF